MRIGIHVNRLPTTVFINRLIEGLVKKGHRVVVFGTQTSDHQQIASVRYASFKLFSTFNFSKRIFFLKYALLLTLFRKEEKRRLDLMLKKNGMLSRHNQTRFYPILWYKPEVLHIQWVKGIEQYLWVKDFGMKLIASLRGTNLYMNPILEETVASGYRLAFPQLDGVHGVCEDVLREAGHYGANRKKSKVIYSGLRLSDFNFLLPSQKEKSEKIKFISVGRQSWMKGYHYALDALAIVQDAGIDFEYTIVGGGDSEELLFQVADLGLTEKVKLKGWMPFSEVKKAIQSSDVLLLPSVSEGIANTAIEAMALGTPVIASACGGMAELITDQQNGFLVLARNREKWVEKLLLFAGLSLARIDEIAANARHTVEERFNEENMVNAFEALYESNFADSLG